MIVTKNDFKTEMTSIKAYIDCQWLHHICGYITNRIFSAPVNNFFLTHLK